MSTVVRLRPRSRGRALALVVVLFALVLAAGPTAGASRPGARAMAPRTVLVVMFPHLTWQRLRDGTTPNLDAFMERAALASMSVRTVGSRTSAEDAYLTVGAGSRGTGTPSAGQAGNRDEKTSTGTVGEVYTRRMGLSARGRVLVLSQPEQVERNREFSYDTHPGAVASALGHAGVATAAVGNADAQLSVGLDQDPAAPVSGSTVSGLPARQIALAAADRGGQIDLGDVGPDLSVPDVKAPFGVRQSPPAVEAAVTAAMRRAGVVMVEMSDLERAEQARVESTPAQGDRQWDIALRRADETFGRLLAGVDPARDLVMVLGPTAPVEDEQLTVFAARGPVLGPPGVARIATSASTRRDGFVTLTDIGPTLLHVFGVKVPKGVNDTPITAGSDSTPTSTRIDAMVRTNERALFRDSSFGPITVGFILVLVVLLVLVAVSVTRHGAGAGPLVFFALVVMTIPAVTYLGGLLPYSPFVTATYALVLVVGAVLVAGAARLGARTLGRGDTLAAPWLISAGAVLLILVDVVLGAPLQLNTVFGYSPIVAGRFAGFGNQVYSLLAVSTLVMATAGWELWERRWPGTTRWRPWVVLGLFAVVVLADGAPSLGSDVGGVLAAVPAFAVCFLMLSGRRVRWRTVLAIGVGTLVVIGVFAAIDLARPAASRTHLGRFVTDLADGGATSILQRKIEANLGVLTSTAWTWVIPVALLFLAYITWRPNRLLAAVGERHPSFRPFGVSALVLGIAAWALNDSGVSMPAMMLATALPYTAVLVLEVVGNETAAEEPDAEVVEAEPATA